MRVCNMGLLHAFDLQAVPFAPFLIPITRPGSSAALSMQEPYLAVVLQTEHRPLVRTPAAQNGTAAGLWKLARVSALATSFNRSLNVPSGVGSGNHGISSTQTSSSGLYSARHVQTVP